LFRCDALIVGGGPAGSTCARILVQAGWNVVVVDRARFPRDKVCAGWLTPEVFRLLDLDPETYRASGLTCQDITGFRTGLVRGRLVETRYPHVVSYAIRRCEFDHYLLCRARPVVRDGTAVASLRRLGDQWIVNDAFQAPVIVGAGGHFCPVARHLSGRVAPDAAVVAQEAEFRIDGVDSSVDSDTPELFFCHDLDGYGWCVRKGDYLNIGLGRRGSEGFLRHQRDFMTFLERTRKAPNASFVRWKGHAYLASGAGVRPLVDDGVMLIGDAAGLAYPESGEGIRPAIEAGRIAAHTLVLAESRYSRDRLLPYDTAMRRLHPIVRPGRQSTRRVLTVLGRALLHSRRFARYVVLDRWFLRSATAQHQSAASN
jgi:geranylgeranyl reductase family protein